MKSLSLIGIAAVAVLGAGLGVAQAAFAPNKVVINDVTLTDTAASQQIFTVNPTNGQSVQSATYTQDVANNARYTVWGHVGGENAGVGTGTATVQDYTDSASVTKTSAFVLNTAEGPGGGMQFLDAYPINPVTTNSVRLSFSLNIVENAGDADDSSFNGAAFAANLFADSSSATRFIAAPNGPSGGKFGLTKADGTLFEVANYVNDKFYDIDVDLNFVTQQATLSVDGVSAGAIPFRNTFGSVPTFSEAFMYQVGYTAVPEPTGIALLGLGAGALLLRRRARHPAN
jgi:hypothetical protein